MALSEAPRRKVGRPKGPAKESFAIYVVPEQRRRFQHLCVENKMTHGELLIALMDHLDATRK